MRTPRRLLPALAAGLALLALASSGPVLSAGKVDDLAGALLGDPSFKVRTQAALLLGKLGDKAGVGPLIKGLSDENKAVRGMAAQSLGKLGGDAGLAALRSLLQRESDAFVRGQDRESPGRDRRLTSRRGRRERSKGLLEVWSLHRRKQSGRCESPRPTTQHSQTRLGG
jgi:hypothetical protein